MKNFFLLLLTGLCMATTSAQAPFSFNYQAIVRDAQNNGAILTAGSVSLKVKIYNAASGGARRYEEEHTGLTPNAFGQITLQIGTGRKDAGVPRLDSLNWGAETLWIETEMSVNGAGYNPTGGRSQLVAVPYAFKAGDANLRYVTTGPLTNVLNYTQSSRWEDGGQQLNVPADGVYLVLCTARAEYNQVTANCFRWDFRVTGSISNQVAYGNSHNNFDYTGSNRALNNGDETVSVSAIARLSKGELLKVEYQLSPNGTQVVSNNWRVMPHRSLSIVKLSD